MKGLDHFTLIQVVTLIPVSALSLSERAQLARSRLFEVLSSPSGKLTLSPEIVIPEPSNPTAILLQASEVTSLSEKIRTKAKANAAFISGALTSMKNFCNEQEQARGNFPGPVPVIYCDLSEDLSEVQEAGAEGILVPVCDGKEISTLDDLTSETAWTTLYQKALESGLQPIPEITIGDSTAAAWKSSDIEALVSKITIVTGAEPISILLTVAAMEDDEGKEVSLPEVPKKLGKRIPILGSIRVTAGAGRMGEETARYKSAGFTGAVLRKECIPSISMSQDLDYLTNFWSDCIGDLKSTKSKTFSFRSRNYLEKSLPYEWAKYQKSVIESGALGEEERHVGLNTNAGDYKGF